MARPTDPIAASRPAHGLKLLLAAAIALFALAPPAAASVGVGDGATAPKLRVDAKGNAEVSYRRGGARHTVLIPVSGAIQLGGRLKGADVSRAATRPKVPFVQVLRRGPGGWVYALQTWPTQVGAPELRFSRWRGSPTKLTLKAKRGKTGISLAGRVTYAGKPIPVKSRVPGGALQQAYVYLDRRVGRKWEIIGGVAVGRNGSYRKPNVGSNATVYRASVAGPNVGAVYLPDTIAQIPPP